MNAFLYPQLTKADIQKVYSEDYFSHEFGIKQGGILDFLLRIRLFSYDDFVSRFVKKRARLLDIGCGDGEFLFTMQKKGWDVYGIEPFGEAVDISRKKVGFERITKGDLVEDNISQKDFDVVTMWHVLEHLSPPVDYLRKIRKLLTDGGYLMIEVPNLDSLNFSIFRKNYNGLVFNEHLLYYSCVGVKRLLEENGFRVASLFSPLKLNSNFAINMADFLNDYYSVNWKLAIWIFSPVSLLVSFMSSLFGKGEVIRIAAKKV